MKNVCSESILIALTNRTTYLSRGPHKLTVFFADFLVPVCFRLQDGERSHPLHPLEGVLYT